MTMADRKLVATVEALQRADVPIRVSRLIGVNPQDAPSRPHDAQASVDAGTGEQ